MADYQPGPAPLPAWLTCHEADPSYRWAILAWRHASAVPGAWFDHAKADAVVAIFPQIFKLTTDRFTGIEFHPSTWQAIVLRLLFGWKKPVEIIDPRSHQPTTVHVRVFRQLRLWIPRKNGKTEFLAALGLLFFLFERIHGAEGYCFARDEEQGNIVFRKMKAMIAMMTEQRRDGVRSFAKTIWVPSTGAAMHLLTGKADGKQGRSPTVIVGDEMHEWATTDLADALREGTGTRLQPMELYASTAGIKSAKTGFELYKESVAIMEGVLDDPSVLVVLFAAPENADWRDEKVWSQANPAIGLTPTWDFLRGQSAKAKGNPRLEANFKRFFLNIWVDQLSRWLTKEAWDACAGAGDWSTRWTDERLARRKCYLALDVSRRRDITALVGLFEPEGDEPWALAARFWIPELRLEQRADQERGLPWKAWAASGAITLTPGDTVDQARMFEAIMAAHATLDVRRLGFDPWNAAKLVTDLQDAGLPTEIMHEMRQGHRTLAEPTQEFEARLYARQIDHGAHPILDWMASHVQVRFDENMNFVPAKKRSADNIDGIQAAVMATGLSLVADDAVEAGMVNL